VNWQLRTRALGLNVLIPLVAVGLALATVALLLVAVGSNPLDAYRDMWNAALGDRFALSTTVTKTMPRLLAALGIALALRAGLWNIGAEGQLYVGALATTAVALHEPDLGAPVMIAAALLAGALAGAGWAMIPGVLRATRGVSEVITSLMLVYIGIQLTNYVLESPWSEPGSTFPSSPYVPDGASLPTIVAGTLLNAGALVGLVLVVVAWFLMSRSTFGLRLNAIGGNERAARIAGVRVSLMIVLAMAASGAFAGLAGGMEVLGVRGRLVEGFSPGYGFEAIAIALLGRLNAFGILGAALLFGALDAGSAGLQTAAQGVPASISQVAEGLAVAYVLIGLGLASIIQRRRAARAALRAAAKGPAAGEPDVLPITPESVVDS
jgi:general nucleoside transport system permease protein